jgi:hypothetical protein
LRLTKFCPNSRPASADASGSHLEKTVSRVDEALWDSSEETGMSPMNRIVEMSCVLDRLIAIRLALGAPYSFAGERRR